MPAEALRTLAPAEMPTEAPAVLKLDGIDKIFIDGAGNELHAVRDANLSIAAGESVALVGESGSGKSTLGRIALGLMQPSRGSVSLRGRDLTHMSAKEFRAARTEIQPVFQDPTASVNPRSPVRQILRQASRGHKGDLEAYGIELLDSVGLRPGAEYMGRLPHELSGGQRQRLSIARALAMKPSLIVADEALSGADVSIRGQILNLLLDIREERGVAFLMITHDISVARAFAHRVCVMRKGQIVESGPAEEVLSNPQHPYTQRLMAAVPAL